MQLKQYQVETLAVLQRFLETARYAGSKGAYESISKEPEQARRLGKYRGDYKPLEGLPDVPYVCLRLPTGGGKTILGAHAVKVARDAWIEKEYPLVLWLVPSNPIRQQTVEALKRPQHAYRQVLDEAFDGRVRVYDIADFTQIRPHDLRANVCLVVGTIQTLRVNSTDGRKVYTHNEEMEPHFSGVAPNTPGLETVKDGPGQGGVRFSFANLLHIHRPLMIVDEAHNAVTELSRAMQERVNPCAIIEFSATPRLDSNILHSVTAQELKREEMIKLPVILAEHSTWQNAVAAAVRDRARLEAEAKKDADYLRPIVLFQAQPRNLEVTIEALKRHLVETEQVPETRIAVATGDQRGLDGIDLFDPKCSIQHVITVKALKEGWDCSFAYVFCSVSRIQNATDVEQLLGRVLRMPYARRRAAQALNQAYAHVSEPSFSEAAMALKDKLIDMGFEEDEARAAIEPAQGSLDETGLFGPREPPLLIFRYELTPTPALSAALRDAGQEAVQVKETDGGRIQIAIAGALDERLARAIVAAAAEPERKGFEEAATYYHAETVARLSAAERGERFVVPRLMAKIQGSLEFADVELFIEDHEWSLLDHAAKLSETEFGVQQIESKFEIDLDGNRVTVQPASQTTELIRDVPVEGWTNEALVAWLERQVRKPDIHPSELVRWLSDCVGHLTGARGISMGVLMPLKFILARKIHAKLDAVRIEERNKSYQRHLFAPEAKVEVSFDDGFAFKEGLYQDLIGGRYQGRYRFAKHFLGPDNVPAFDGAVDGEEFQCAVTIDSLPSVKHWLRSIARHPASFWLPVASGRFYPDFVAELHDGRLLVAEYKGELTASGTDTDEKRAVGFLWERQSQGMGLFLIVEKTVDGKDMRAQLMAKTGA